VSDTEIDGELVHQVSQWMLAAWVDGTTPEACRDRLEEVIIDALGVFRARVLAECARVLRPGGYVHVAVPFCHPFHAYPNDYTRWSLEGLRELLADFHVLDAGMRTGPTATLLAVVLEYVKVISPRALRKPLYAVFGWLLWPLRYVDVWLNNKREAAVLANHIYALAQKPRETMVES
jgi:SAM-dependent methyltransferase